MDEKSVATAMQLRVRSNWEQLQSEVADAVARSSRPADSVTIVGVTKYVDLNATRCLLDAGCHDLAESRPQSLWSKAEQLADHSPRWHLIGHLQRNKAKRTIPCLHLMHSLDSLRLLEQLETDCAATGKKLDVLLEVNVTSDESKTGVRQDQLSELLDGVAKCSHIRLRGVMGMASLEGGSDQARRDFAAIRGLFESIRGQSANSESVDVLSMGMSGDFAEAILEGSTMIRVGSRLFDGLES